jgi:class 3 adenylate cyclase
MGNDVGGVTVHATARIMGLAGPSEIYASSVTVGLADGSDLAFETRGPQQVKGLARPIEVFELTG